MNAILQNWYSGVPVNSVLEPVTEFKRLST